MRNFDSDPKYPGTTKSIIDQSSERRFSTGVPVSATRNSATSLLTLCVCLAEGFLMSCASSSTSVFHDTRIIAVRSARDQGVAREDHVHIPDRLDEGVAGRPIGPVMKVCRHAGGEAGDFGAVLQDGRGADDEVGQFRLSRPALLGVFPEERDHLQRLS